MHAQVDLRVTGARNQWCITVDPDNDSGQFITAADLGDEVTEAMFRWAQRRRISAPEEVELLGRLLSRALFPGPVASHVQSLAGADEVLVRLHIAQDSKLDDIPWELAAVPASHAAVPASHGADKYLAASKKFRFVRVVDTAEPAPPPAVEDAPIRVLGVFALPQSWKFPTVYGEESPYDWPPFDDIVSGFRGHFAGKDSMQPLLRPEITDLENKLGSRPPWDVLHYVGVGRIGKRGQAQVTFVNPEGDETWQDADKLIRSAADNGVRLVVLEFVLPPTHRLYEDISPSSLGTLLQKSICAVVFTRFPVHPRQFHRFNRAFYQHLEQGDTVETAMQFGRHNLAENIAIEDAAGFGWFTLLTGPKPEIRLVPQRVVSPQQPAPKGTWEDYRDNAREAVSRRTASGDAFGRRNEEPS